MTHFQGHLCKIKRNIVVVVSVLLQLRSAMFSFHRGYIYIKPNASLTLPLHEYHNIHSITCLALGIACTATADCDTTTTTTAVCDVLATTKVCKISMYLLFYFSKLH